MRTVFMYKHTILYCTEFYGHTVYIYNTKIRHVTELGRWRYFFRKSDVTLIHLKIAIYNNVLLCENWSPEVYISVSFCCVFSLCWLPSVFFFFLDKQTSSELSRCMSDFSTNQNLLLIFINRVQYNGHAHIHKHHTAIVEHKRQRENLKSIQRGKTLFSKEW